MYPYVPYVTRMLLVALMWCFSHDRFSIASWSPLVQSLNSFLRPPYRGWTQVLEESPEKTCKKNLCLLSSYPGLSSSANPQIARRRATRSWARTFQVLGLISVSRRSRLQKSLKQGVVGPRVGRPPAVPRRGLALASDRVPDGVHGRAPVGVFG